MLTQTQHGLQHDELLIFLHVPKTAGTSLNALLERQFAPDEVAPFHTGAVSVPQTAELIRQTSVEILDQYRYLATHLDYSIHSYFTRTPVFITLLRNPIDRVISNYRHLKQHRTRLYDVVRDMSLGEFLVSQKTRDQYFNRQTCQLAGFTIDAELSLPPEDELLEVAKQHLEETTFFGLQEHFGASLHLLNYTFGWSIKYESRVLNASQQRSTWEELPSDLLHLIVERNQLDLALYRHAEELFNQRLEAMLGELLCRAEELSYIRHDWTWKTLLKLHELRLSLTPSGSRRERWYRYVRDGVLRR